jgi:hypothetical protein
MIVSWASYKKQHHVDNTKVCYQLKHCLDPFGARIQWPFCDWAAEHSERNLGKATS